jgi:hypothetical protein
MIAACGNRCDLCPRFTATQSGSPAQLSAVAELWHRVGFRDRMMGSAEMACQGCGMAGGPHACPHGVLECADAKGHANCGLCPDMGSCAKVQAMLDKGADQALRCRVLADPQEFSRLDAAFFHKQENLRQAKAGLN